MRNSHRCQRIHCQKGQSKTRNNVTCLEILREEQAAEISKGKDNSFLLGVISQFFILSYISFLQLLLLQHVSSFEIFIQ